MMLPSALQHVRDLDEPWSPLEVDEGGTPLGPSSPRPTQHSTRSTETPSTPAARMPSRGAGRPGRRQGPLSLESRQNANDVRKERSCLRCFVYKETCDTSKDVCQNCSNKQARTWKLGCVRPRLMFRTHYLLPGKKNLVGLKRIGLIKYRCTSKPPRTQVCGFLHSTQRVDLQGQTTIRHPTRHWPGPTSSCSG